MVLKGPIITPPTYSPTGGGGFIGPGVNSEGYYTLTIPGTGNRQPQPTDAQIQAAQLDAHTIADSRSASVTNGLYYETNYRGGVFGPWSTTLIASEFFSPRPISPLNSADYMWRPDNYFTPPEGAIGWEWADGYPTEARPSDILSCVLYIGLTDGTATDTSTGATLTNWSTNAVLADGVAYTSDVTPILDVPTGQDALTAWGGPTTGTIIDTYPAGTPTPMGGPDDGDWQQIDLMPYLDEKGRATYYFRVDPPYIIPGNKGMDERGVRYGFGRADEVHWVFQPPPYRWLFEGETRVRQYPRRDTYGLGTAARTYPLPSADRIVGGQP